MRHPRNAQLEAKIIATKDPGFYDVYADWLQAEGSPLGELIAIERRLAEGEDAKLAKRAGTLIAELDLPGEDFATYGLKWGLFDWVRLENQDDFMDDDFEALPIAKRMFDTPLAVGMRELRIGVLRWEVNYSDAPAVIEEAGRYEFAKGLERLHLGDVDPDIDMAHHTIGDVGRVITNSFPNLRSLKLHSGEQDYAAKRTFEIDGLDLPRLESLTIETCSMSKHRLKALLDAKLPALTNLEIWFGAANYGADSTLPDLQKLLDGEVFSTVTALGLMNAEFSDEIAATLPGSPIASRLTSVDLSLGTLSDLGAEALASHANAFVHLDRLNVDDNFLTEGGLRRLTGAFGRKKVESKRQKTAYQHNPELRYVSVGE